MRHHKNYLYWYLIFTFGNQGVSLTGRQREFVLTVVSPWQFSEIKNFTSEIFSKYFIWNIFGNQLSLFFRKEIIQNFVIGKVSQIENKTRKNILESMKMNFLYNFEQRIKIMRLMVQINFFVWRVFPNVYLCNLRQNDDQLMISTLVFNFMAKVDMFYK